jgi:hypothetical protein
MSTPAVASAGKTDRQEACFLLGLPVEFEFRKGLSDSVPPARFAGQALAAVFNN